MRRLWRWVCAGGEVLCVRVLVGAMLVSGVSKGWGGGWGRAVPEVSMVVFMVIISRLFVRFMTPPPVMSEPVPVTTVFVTCVVETCGEAWVLRACHTLNRMVLEEGDMVRLGLPRGMDDA
jgi:hypothetical protein